MRFGEILDAADQLSIEEQETLVDVLHRRVVETRREELALEIEQARHEHQAGQSRPATAAEIAKTLLP
ncbi:MAG TPA: hypothetical protein VHR45_10080 [Thermoanaerobaculia bacterium]|nr:hypothetical protein [Thermoanaerobaculia bacterium]